VNTKVIKDNKLKNKILKLKKKKRAVILAHNYQRSEIQDIADFVGDSLELSLCAAQTEAERIIFCGVNFMAETASILNPEKKVYIPDKNASCPMAAMLPAEIIPFYKKKYPDAKVVLYINSLAKAKALSDAISTSANSAEIINLMNSKKVLFGPDQNLAQYVNEYTNKEVIPIPSSGFCPVHKLFNKKTIIKLKKSYPNAKILAHPECTKEIREIADFVGSTSKMYRESLISDSKTFIIATEVGLLHRLKKERKDANFIPAYDEAICASMKLHTLEKIYQSLKNEIYLVKLSQDIMDNARKTVEIMLKAKETQS
jgi:quinolinate synthase